MIVGRESLIVQLVVIYEDYVFNRYIILNQEMFEEVSWVIGINYNFMINEMVYNSKFVFYSYVL